MQVSRNVERYGTQKQNEEPASEYRKEGGTERMSWDEKGEQESDRIRRPGAVIPAGSSSPLQDLGKQAQLADASRAHLI